MNIKLSAKETTIDGHAFSMKTDRKTIVAMMVRKLGQKAAKSRKGVSKDENV